MGLTRQEATMTQNPVAQNPVVQNPVVQDPVVQDPVADHPVIGKFLQAIETANIPDCDAWSPDATLDATVG